MRWQFYSEIITLKITGIRQLLVKLSLEVGRYSFLAAEHASIMLKRCITRKMVTEVAKTAKAATSNMNTSNSQNSTENTIFTVHRNLRFVAICIQYARQKFTKKSAHNRI